MKEPDKIYCLIVTYANRFVLFEKVFNRVLQEKIDKIIVVNNNVMPESKIQLLKFKEKYPAKFEIVDLPRNTGTAFAFKTGLEYICQYDECKYIWLLDDDNLPEEGTLNKLREFSSDLEKSEDREFCLTSDRVGSHYKNCIRNNNPMISIARMNSFWGFHFGDLPEKIKKRLLMLPISEKPLPQEYGEIKMVPYGGLFININIIKKIGLPDIDYFMYVDDYEYTYRISNAGYKIYLLGTAKIHDIEKGWEAGLKGFHFSRIAMSKNPVRLYYSARNMIKFQKKNTTTNVIIFYLNFSLFIILFLIFCIINLKFKNIHTMFKAIYAALNNETGESTNYRIRQL